MPRLALGAPVRVARFTALERRVVAEQLRVRPDDRERRPQLVGDERDQLRACLVDLAQLLEPLLCLGLLAALLHDPGQKVGDRLELRDIGVAEQPLALRLDVEDADDLIVPRERHAEHRRDEPALVDAADPQEAVVGPHVGDDERLAARRDPAGDALAERDPGAADLVSIEAVRRGQGQGGSIAIASTTVSRSSSQVRAVVARRAT